MKAYFLAGIFLFVSLALYHFMKKLPTNDDTNAETTRSPNIILFTIDTLRADHLGCYGYERIDTPNIDKLAREGVLFESAISQIPLTAPSHSSIFTSLYPRNHGVLNNAQRLDHSFLTLTEVLEESGYVTAGFVSCFVLKEKYGMSQGFDTYYDDVEIRDPNDPKHITYISSKQLNQQIIPWLRQNANDRFFLWIHYFDPHNPYESHAADSIHYDSGYDPHPTGVTKPAEILQKIARYDSEITFVDRAVGEILEVLRSLGQTKHTMVILTSDHGEGLYQHHNVMGHAFFLYDSQVRIPLIIRYPGQLPASARISKLVESVDIMPTVLELLEIDIPSGIDGKSFLSVMAGEKPTKEVTFSETYKPEGKSNKFAIRTDQWKYIYVPERNTSELYNLRADPMELHNLISQRRDLAERFSMGYSDWLNRDAAKIDQQLDDATKEKLRSLGYVN